VRDVEAKVFDERQDHGPDPGRDRRPHIEGFSGGGGAGGKRDMANSRRNFAAGRVLVAPLGGRAAVEAIATLLSRANPSWFHGPLLEAVIEDNIVGRDFRYATK